jgi:hypothetical protein
MTSARGDAARMPRKRPEEARWMASAAASWVPSGRARMRMACARNFASVRGNFHACMHQLRQFTCVLARGYAHIMRIRMLQGNNVA